jgi:hypothetical protein
MAPKAKAKVKPPVKTPKKAPPAKKVKAAKANEDDPTEEKADADQASPSQANKPEKLYAKITRHMHTLSAFVSLSWLQPHEKRTRLIQRDGVRNILRNIEVVGKF